MRYRPPLLLISGLASVTFSGMSELTAKASTTDQQANSPMAMASEAKIHPATTYSVIDRPELKIESNINPSPIITPALATDFPEDYEVTVSSKSSLPSVDLSDRSLPIPVAQKTYSNQLEVEAALIASKSDKVESDIPTISEANLPPVATTQNSAALLQQPQSAQDSNQATLAQASEEEQFPPAEEVIPDEVDPGRSTRSGTSYIGVGANFGVGGDTSLGDSGLFLYSKVGLTRYFSIRPAVNTNFDEDATFLLPLTFDLAPIAIGNTGVSLAPYFGGGPAISTTGDFGPVLSGGVDMPLTKNLTVTSGVNIGILDEADVGVFLGIGYSFPNLF